MASSDPHSDRVSCTHIGGVSSSSMDREETEVDEVERLLREGEKESWMVGIPDDYINPSVRPPQGIAHIEDADPKDNGSKPSSTVGQKTQRNRKRRQKLLQIEDGAAAKQRTPSPEPPQKAKTPPAPPPKDATPPPATAAVDQPTNSPRYSPVTRDHSSSDDKVDTNGTGGLPLIEQHNSFQEGIGLLLDFQASGDVDDDQLGEDDDWPDTTDDGQTMVNADGMLTGQGMGHYISTGFVPAPGTEGISGQQGGYDDGMQLGTGVLDMGMQADSGATDMGMQADSGATDTGMQAASGALDMGMQAASGALDTGMRAASGTLNIGVHPGCDTEHDFALEMHRRSPRVPAIFLGVTPVPAPASSALDGTVFKFYDEQHAELVNNMNAKSHFQDQMRRILRYNSSKVTCWKQDSVRTCWKEDHFKALYLAEVLDWHWRETIIPEGIIPYHDRPVYTKTVRKNESGIHFCFAVFNHWNEMARDTLMNYSAPHSGFSESDKDYVERVLKALVVLHVYMVLLDEKNRTLRAKLSGLDYFPLEIRTERSAFIKFVPELMLTMFDKLYSVITGPIDSTKKQTKETRSFFESHEKLSSLRLTAFAQEMFAVNISGSQQVSAAMNDFIQDIFGNPLETGVFKNFMGCTNVAYWYALLVADKALMRSYNTMFTSSFSIAPELVQNKENFYITAMSDGFYLHRQFLPPLLFQILVNIIKTRDKETDLAKGKWKFLPKNPVQIFVLAGLGLVLEKEDKKDRIVILLDVQSFCYALLFMVLFKLATVDILQNPANFREILFSNIESAVTGRLYVTCTCIIGGHILIQFYHKGAEIIEIDKKYWAPGLFWEEANEKTRSLAAMFISEEPPPASKKRKQRGGDQSAAASTPRVESRETRTRAKAPQSTASDRLPYPDTDSDTHRTIRGSFDIRPSKETGDIGVDSTGVNSRPLLGCVLWIQKAAPRLSWP